MKILVTGGAGFIGSNIAEKLLKNGNEVDILDNLSTGFEKNIPEGAGFFHNSISDPQIKEILKNGYDVICHQAAQINLRKSVLNPITDLTDDVTGSVILFEEAVKAGVKHIVFASSGGAIYGDQEVMPTPETCETCPESPYAINKLTIEKYLKYYYKTFRVKYTCLRYANVYGPRQNALAEAGVVAVFIKNILNNRKSTINGTGAQTRDFVYVEDVAKANILSVEKGFCGEINIGTSKETDINTIYDTLAEISGYPQKPDHGPALKGEQFRSVLKVEKARKDLGWEPTVDLRQGMEETYMYFLNEQKK